MGFEGLVAYRYFWRKGGEGQSGRFISFVALVSILGMALGVAALIVVLSVMSGFQQEIRQRILGMTPHITIGGLTESFSDATVLADQLRQMSFLDVAGVSAYVAGQGLLVNRQRARGVVFHGIDPQTEHEVLDLSRWMLSGRVQDLQPRSFQIILGRGLAQQLGVGVGDPVQLVIPKVQMTFLAAIPRLRVFTVAGIFESGMSEYDQGFAAIALADAQALLQLQGVSGLQVRLVDAAGVQAKTRQLQQQLSRGYHVSDWTQQHGSLFRAIQLEKKVMFIILALIVAVAAFNIVSTLVMLVTEKKGDIAILKTLGASSFEILSVFMWLGLMIGLIGTVLGLVLGLGLAFNLGDWVMVLERWLQVALVDQDVYFIDYLPTQVEGADVGWVVCVALFVTFLASAYPSWMASRVVPVVALRQGG